MTIREDVRAELSWKSAFRIAWAILIVNLTFGGVAFVLISYVVKRAFTGHP